MVFKSEVRKTITMFYAPYGEYMLEKQNDTNTVFHFHCISTENE